MPERDIDRLTLQAWQRVDDAHPPEAGRPAYRVVFKTLRVVLGEGSIRFPNLLLRFGHGSVERGGVHLGPAVRGRRRGAWYLPESGRLVEDDGALRYEPEPPLNFEFHGWEDEVKNVFFVEMILVCESVDPRDRLAEGRRNLASLKTLPDLRFGPRFLGLLLTEEVGELHADDHWPRTLASEQLANEWSFDVEAVGVDELQRFNDGPLARHIGRSTKDKLRLRLACEWYWSAIRADDPVTEYLELWFVVEALAMPDTTNVAPVKDLLARRSVGSGPTGSSSDDTWAAAAGSFTAKTSAGWTTSAERAATARRGAAVLGIRPCGRGARRPPPNRCRTHLDPRSNEHDAVRGKP